MTKFIGHSQNLKAAMPLIRKYHPEYWKVIDPDPILAAECQQLGVKLIVRHYNQEWDSGEPENVVSPTMFVGACQQQLWFPFAWAIETPNEPHPGKASWMADVLTAFKNLGKETVVGNWGTGWDGFFVEGAKYYGVHEYGWPHILSQEPWHAMRHTGWFANINKYNPDVKLFVTEFGVTQAVEGRADIGWRTGNLSSEEQVRYFNTYLHKLSKEGYVEAAAYYQIGGFDDWATHELTTDMADELLTQVVEDNVMSKWALDLSFSAKLVTTEWCLNRQAQGWEMLIVDAWTGSQSPELVDHALRTWRETGHPIAAYYVPHAYRPAPEHFDRAREAIGDEWEHLEFLAIDVESIGSYPMPEQFNYGHLRHSVELIQANNMKPIAYTSRNQWYALGNPEWLADLPLWDASYGTEISLELPVPYGGWTTRAMHQYQNDTYIAGIATDLNFFNAALIAQPPVHIPDLGRINYALDLVWKVKSHIETGTGARDEDTAAILEAVIIIKEELGLQPKTSLA